jgi:hypothetical protein
VFIDPRHILKTCRVTLTALEGKIACPTPANQDGGKPPTQARICALLLCPLNVQTHAPPLHLQDPASECHMQGVIQLLRIQAFAQIIILNNINIHFTHPWMSKGNLNESSHGPELQSGQEIASTFFMITIREGPCVRLKSPGWPGLPYRAWPRATSRALRPTVWLVWPSPQTLAHAPVHQAQGAPNQAHQQPGDGGTRAGNRGLSKRRGHIECL